MATDKPRNITVLIYGPPGCGKSRLLQQIKKAVDPKLLEDVEFMETNDGVTAVALALNAARWWGNMPNLFEHGADYRDRMLGAARDMLSWAWDRATITVTRRPIPEITGVVGALDLSPLKPSFDFGRED